MTKRERLNNKKMSIDDKVRIFMASLLEGWSLTLSKHRAGLTKEEYNTILKTSDIVFQMREHYVRNMYNTSFN